MDVSWHPDEVDPRVARAVQLAHADILRVRETPMGSNRSPIIDEYNREFGSPLGSFWCGNALGVWWKRAGLEHPAVPGAVVNWKTFGFATGRWSAVPVIGAAAIYGSSIENPSHCGLVYDLESPRVVFDIEGNTSLDGYSRNGELVTGKLVRLDWLLGYVHPFPT